jgi:WD40 repeat protein
VSSVEFAGTHQLVSGSDDRTVKVWDLRTYNTPLCTIRCPARVNRVGVCPVSQRVAVPMDDKQIRVYDLKGNRPIRFHSKERPVGPLVLALASLCPVFYVPYLSCVAFLLSLELYSLLNSLS